MAGGAGTRNPRSARRPGYDDAVWNETVERLRERWGAPRVALAGFVVRFLLYLWVFTSLVLRIPDLVHLRLQEATAVIEHAVLMLFTDRVTRHSNVLTYDGFGVENRRRVFRSPRDGDLRGGGAGVRDHLEEASVGLLTGVPTIYLFNLVRILMLLIVGRYSRALFDFAHLYFWQATLIVVITALWLLWIRFVVRDETGAVAHA